MDSKVDVVVHKRAVEFLGEEALAARLAERAILNLVAGCADDDDFYRRRLRTERRSEALLNLISLRQRQGAATRAYSQSRREGACRKRIGNCRFPCILG
jgi:hypothetical protein